MSVSSNPNGSDGSGSVMTFGKPDNNKELNKSWKYNLKGSGSYYQGFFFYFILFFFFFYFFFFLKFFLS